MKLSYIDPGTGFIIFSLGGWLLALATGILGFVTLFFKRILNFIRTHKGVVLALSGAIVIGSLIIAGFFFMNNREEAGFQHKIIILGMDGLSPEIVEPMMKKGELPHFSRLRSQGSYRRLRTTHPPQSPVAWAAFATGKNPGKTGMFDFILRDPKNYQLKLSLSNTEKGRAKSVIHDKRFWHYTSDRKIPTMILGCPLTFPPDKIYGKMLSGMGVPDALGTEGTFSFYTTDLLSKKVYTGGKVFYVDRGRAIQTQLAGPKKRSLTGKVDPVKVPFKIVKKDERGIYILFQDNRFELKTGEWSTWKEVTFKLGFMKKLRGILKFYLVSVEPELNLYVSPINFHPEDPYFPISYPKGYSKELAARIGLFHTQGMPIDTWAVNEGRLDEEASLGQISSVLAEKIKILDEALSHFQRGLFFFYFGSPDAIQHMFWRYRDPQHPLYEADAPKAYQSMIPDWYVKMDRILGKVMEGIGPGDTLMVLSDHGFGTFRRAVHLNSWLRENGYLKLKDSEMKSGRELLADIDWSRTKAYAVGFGGIYVNQQGREKDGIVGVGQETRMLKKEISEKLTGWVDEKYGDAIVSKVYLQENIFKGDRAHDAPDIYVGFHNGYRASWQTAMGAVPEGLVEDNLKKWSGDHLFDPDLVPGIFFVNQSVVRDTASIYDIAPTILKAVGYEDAEISRLDLDGRALF